MQPERSNEQPPEIDREVWSEGALTVTGCAEFMACSRKTIFEKMKSGELVWGRFGSHRRIPRRSAIDLLAGQTPELDPNP